MFFSRAHEAPEHDHPLLDDRHRGVEPSRVEADDELAGAQFGLLLQVSWPIFRSWCVSEFNSIGPNYSFRFPVSSPELACLLVGTAYLSCGDGDELHQIRSDQIRLDWIGLG